MGEMVAVYETDREAVLVRSRLIFTTPALRARVWRMGESTEKLWTVLSQHPDRLVRAARPRSGRRGQTPRLSALVQDQDRTIHPGHAHQAPCQIIATRFMPTSPRPATTQEIMEVQQAWAQAAA
jgi:hypothetical protein